MFENMPHYPSSRFMGTVTTTGTTKRQKKSLDSISRGDDADDDAAIASTTSMRSIVTAAASPETMAQEGNYTTAHDGRMQEGTRRESDSSAKVSDLNLLASAAGKQSDAKNDRGGNNEDDENHDEDDSIIEGERAEISEQEHVDEEEEENYSNNEKEEESLINTRISINDLGFEILDTIFSFFSNPQSNSSNSTLSSEGTSSNSSSSTGLSHYENQQNLLSFCQVNKAFYKVAKLHLSRYIPIASTFKARQVLSLCQEHQEDDQKFATSPSLLEEEHDSFGSRVHSLLLIWPDQGKYLTRRTSVITEKEFHSLLTSFNTLRNLEFNCLPYFNRLTPLLNATLSSLGSLNNLRSLSFNGSPFLLSQKEESSIINSLLLLIPKLEKLSIINIPLNSLIECLAEEEEEESSLRPSFRLKSLTIKISSARILNPQVLEWMLKSTIQAQSCKDLTIWLSKKCTDRYNEHNENILSVKENEGFKDLDIPLSKLSPSLNKLSIMGLRIGQASTILSKTTQNLKILQIYDTFGYGNDSSILNDFPLPSNLERLEILPNPSIAFGAIPLATESVTTIATASNTGNGRGRNHNSSGSVNTAEVSATIRTNAQRENATAASSNATSSSNQGNSSSVSNSTMAITINESNESSNANSNTIPHTFTEIPISSYSFIAELGKGNRLENLKVVRIPVNARFGKRGRWNNKELNKACKRFGVIIEEV